MSLFPDTTLNAASSSSTDSATWAAWMARSATVFEVTTSGKLSGRSVAFSGFLAMTVAVATYAGLDVRDSTPIAAVVRVVKKSGTAAAAGHPVRGGQVIRVIRGNGSRNDLPADGNMAAADVQPGAVDGARRDGAVSAGGRVAAGRDPQPGDRPAIQAGAAKDI